jgi:hypothetical protein
MTSKNIGNGHLSAISFDENSDNKNTLILSLYLIDSEDDLIRGCSQHTQNLDANRRVCKRARLYQRLCRACAIANNVLRSSSSTSEDDSNPCATRIQSERNTNYRPWSSGGDGPIFGVHCDVNSDENFINATNDIDGDDMWQSQPPSNQQAKNLCDDMNDTCTTKKSNQYQCQQPHLRALCRYGNDVNDMWRCIALALRISSVLASSQSEEQINLTCAIECWDMSDGHILLIEAAEHLPSWVDDDALQGGVGGPAGCRNRCWVVDGKVHLIPPSKVESSPFCDSSETGRLSRDSALLILTRSMKMNGRGSGITLASGAVQRSIQDRIDRTDYTHLGTKNASLSRGAAHGETHITDNSHWHVAAAALPASVARFLLNHPSLLPIIVDSFCTNAPKLQRMNSEGSGSKSGTGASIDEKIVDGESPLEMKEKNTNRSTSYSSTNPLGSAFPYEQIVIFPIVLTRTNYAELVTGRGIVPSFPIPSAYRSVELNRFQRHLRQSVFGGESFEDGDGTSRRMKNPFERAIDVGVRLCAGLDWICNDPDDSKASVSSLDPDINMENIAIDTLGEVERRLRIYWTRVDIEASGGCEQEDLPPLPWIEQAWKAGPIGSGIQNVDFDASLLRAIEHMTRCLVFNPELCQPLRKAPCPYSRPGVTLFEMVQSGIKSALKWQRLKFNEDSFPMPKAIDLNDDGWMDVNSLEELEEEMKNLSNLKVNTDTTTGSVRPRRTTRRSRVGREVGRISRDEDEQDAQPKEDAEALNKILAGFRSFVDGEGELEGAVTSGVRGSPLQFKPEQQNQNSSELDCRHDVSHEVNIDPRKFLNTLHSMLSKHGAPQPDNEDDHDHISKFFFQEDLDDGDMSDNSDVIVENADSVEQYQSDQDYWSIQNYMVSHKKLQDRFYSSSTSNKYSFQPDCVNRKQWITSSELALPRTPL